MALFRCRRAYLVFSLYQYDRALCYIKLRLQNRAFWLIHQINFNLDNPGYVPIFTSLLNWNAWMFFKLRLLKNILVLWILTVLPLLFVLGKLILFVKTRMVFQAHNLHLRYRLPHLFIIINLNKHIGSLLVTLHLFSRIRRVVTLS